MASAVDVGVELLEKQAKSHCEETRRLRARIQSLEALLAQFVSLDEADDVVREQYDFMSTIVGASTTKRFNDLILDAKAELIKGKGIAK